MAKDTIAFRTKEVGIPLGPIELYGSLTQPETQQGLVIFVHGSGSGRFSPRNQYVAQYLNQTGFSTLLFDLLTQDEEIIDERTREYRFDIPMLAERLIGVTDWVGSQPELHSLSLGYFGASTGAAAALIAAAERPEAVHAVISRGGRPDLAGQALPKVNAPTLLLVGEWDQTVIDLNLKAQALMTCPTELKIIPGATHLFEEPGKLDEVMHLAGSWFERYLI